VRRGALLALALLCGAGSAQALTPTAQDRHVFARRFLQNSLGVSDVSETASAPDYAPFVTAVDGVTMAIPNPPQPIARLSSTIEPERLRATGSSVARAPSIFEVNNFIDAESVYSVDFVLDEQRPFTLLGQLDVEITLFGPPTHNCGASTGRIALSGPSGVVAEVAATQSVAEAACGIWSPCASSLPLAATGVLEPGSYRLEARVDTSSQGGFFVHSKCDVRATGSYRAALTLSANVPALPPAALSLLGVVLLGAARAASRRAS
jgi:hypothetical protein